MSGVLEVVRAGAGSGKTTNLCDEVAAAVEGGLDPAQILATTFTRKAAVQLKGRIQARLLKAADKNAKKAHYRADRLELAAIGTVHSVAHQLISRYAVSMGLSPRLTVLDESGSARTLHNLLGEMEEEGWSDVYSIADCLALDGVPSLVLRLLALQRGNRISDDDLQAQLAASADRLCQLLARQPAANGVSFDRLYEAVGDALQQIRAIVNDPTQTTEKAIQKLSRLFAQRLREWRSHVYACSIEAGKRSGANDALNNLRAEAGLVRSHPELHAHIRDLAKCIAERTIQLGQRYQAYKQERGLVDFTDLEVLFLELLESEKLSASLRSDYELVLVDEFQDTNPLQLAIFQRLRELAPRNRWVGDPKQAIYGFRDADPDLVNTVWDNAAEAQRTVLPKNFRAQKGLVQLVSTLFQPVFGDDALQEPHKDGQPRGVERWILDSRNQDHDSLTICCGIAQLRGEGCEYRDMALLARTNRQLERIASAMDDLGIPYLLESSGLLATREGALLLAGLRLVADRGDSLAAATILHLLEDPTVATPAWFGERLRAMQEGMQGEEGKPTYLYPWKNDLRLKPLESIDARVIPPSTIVQRVIEALRIPTMLPSWGDPSRRNAHLDSLFQHAVEYEQLAIGEGRAATLTGLILHFERMRGEKRDVRHAPLGHNAVTLLTYHTAKGLEWPVVVLCELDYARDPDLWSPAVFGDAIDHANPLAGRALRYWCWPFGLTDGEFAQKLTGSGLEVDALNSEEGQAKAHSEAAEALRLLYVGFTRARSKLVLAHRQNKCSWLSQIPDIDALLSTARPDSEYTIDSIETTFVIRTLRPNLADGCRITRSHAEQWLSGVAPAQVVESIERYHVPSAALSLEGEWRCDTVPISDAPYFPSGAKEDHYAPIGDAVHAYLAALPSLKNCSAEVKERAARRCINGFSVAAFLSAEVLVRQGEAFSKWVDEQYPGARWHAEVPVTAPRNGGGQWVGTIDLLLETPEGDVVLVDHKSAPIRREHCEGKAKSFSGQLTAYRDILSAAGVRVRDALVHFPLPGVVCLERSLV